MAAATTMLSLKLLIDAKVQRVLFAEAGKDVVDFLFSFLALPVSTAVKLIGKDSMVGSVGNLYSSVEELDDTYVLPGVAKGALLRPTAASPAISSYSSLLSLPEPSSGQPKKIYTCTNSTYNTYSTSTYSTYTKSNCHTYVTDVYGKACPCCINSMTTPVNYLSGEPVGRAGKGFVQGIVTYMVMDNLTVTPMSAVTLLNTLTVTDIGALQQKTVQVGYNEGLAILKASLQSKTVLTDVFLDNKKACVINVDDDEVAC